MTRFYLDNGRVARKVESTKFTLEQIQKEETPTGYIRFKDKFFLLETFDLPEKALFCTICKENCAKVTGKFIGDDDVTYYVIQCPRHPNDTQIIEQYIFHAKYNNVLTEKTTNNEDFPKQKSYCKNCRGTTGKIVDSTKYAWKIRCDCGEEWFENKIRFAVKYIGENDTPPLFQQRSPITPKKYYDPKTIILPVQNEKIHENENIELEVNGITISVPKGATLKTENGKIIIKVK